MISAQVSMPSVPVIQNQIVIGAVIPLFHRIGLIVIGPPSVVPLFISVDDRRLHSVHFPDPLVFELFIRKEEHPQNALAVFQSPVRAVADENGRARSAISEIIFCS
jgi:hypothetical protein